MVIEIWAVPPPTVEPALPTAIDISATWPTVGRIGMKSSELVRMKLSWMLMPSSVTLAAEVRMPLITVVPRPSLTPAWVVNKVLNWRDAVGRFCTCSRGMVLTSSLPPS